MSVVSGFSRTVALYSGRPMVYAQPPKNFTHGDILRWRKVGGLILAEVQYAPGQRVQRHVHPHTRFVLVLAGGITEIRGDETGAYKHIVSVLNICSEAGVTNVAFATAK